MLAPTLAAVDFRFEAKAVSNYPTNLARRKRRRLLCPQGLREKNGGEHHSQDGEAFNEVLIHDRCLSESPRRRSASPDRQRIAFASSKK